MRVVIVLMLFISTLANSQNLVPNPGFEAIKDTIDRFTEDDADFISKIEYWTTPNTASPDLITPDFHEKYIKPAAPRSGSNMVGVQAKPDWTEYLCVTLTADLVPYQTYYAEFWIRRAFCINPRMNFDQHINERFGILFLPEPIKTDNGNILVGNPQVAVDTPLIITDQEWVKVSAYFTPETNYKQLYIGQFCEDDERPEIMTGYYVIDDVLVEPLTDYEALDKGIGLPVGSIIPLRQINFLTGSTTLSSNQSYALLENIAGYLKQNPSMRIRINGHTDSLGSSRSNLTLSKKRARFIAKNIIQQGISKDRIAWKGFGEDQPIADNDIAAGRSKNRRVEFEVIE